MGIQQVGGSRVYVITGTKTSASSGQAWANFVTQQKYRLWEEAMKEAERQIGYDQLDYQAQVSIYNDQRKDLLRRAQEKERQAERLRSKEISVKQGLVEDKVREENLRGRPKRMTTSAGTSTTTGKEAARASQEQSRELKRYRDLGTELYYAQEDRNKAERRGEDTADFDDKIDDLQKAQDASWKNYSSLAGLSGVESTEERSQTDTATSRSSRSYYTQGATIAEATARPEFEQRIGELTEEAEAFRLQAAGLERPTMERRSVLGAARDIYSQEFAQPPRRDGLGFARFLGNQAVQAARSRGEQLTPEREQQIKREALTSFVPTGETEEAFVTDLLAEQEQPTEPLFSAEPQAQAEAQTMGEMSAAAQQRFAQQRSQEASQAQAEAQRVAAAQTLGRKEAEAARAAFPTDMPLTETPEALRRRELMGTMPMPRDVGMGFEDNQLVEQPAPPERFNLRDMELRMLGIEPTEAPPEPATTPFTDTTAGTRPQAAPTPFPELQDVLVETDTLVFTEASPDLFTGLTEAGAEQELNRQMAAVDKRFTKGTNEHKEQVNKLMDAYATATKPYRASVVKGAKDYDNKKLERTTKGPNIPKWAELVSSLFDPNNPQVRRDKKTFLTNAYEQITIAYNKEPETMKKAHELLIALDTLTEQSMDAEQVSQGEITDGETQNQ